MMGKPTEKQYEATIGASSVLMTVGFYLFGDTYLVDSLTQLNEMSDEMFHLAISWHMAFMIGAAAAFTLTKEWRKQQIYLIAGALVASSGILMAISWNSLLPIIIARYLGGLGHGLAFLTLIVHSSEIALSDFRAKVMDHAMGTICSSNIFVFLILFVYSFIEQPSISIGRALGILTVIFAILGMLCMWSCIESPIFHLERGEREVAETCLKQLRHKSIEPEKIQADMIEMESLVRTQENSKFPTIKATIRVIILRGLYSLSIFFVYSFNPNYFVVSNFNYYGLGFAYFGRILAEALTTSEIDKKGRRLFLIISILGGGLCMVIIGFLPSNVEINAWGIWVGIILLFTFNHFVGAGLSTISVVLLGESFHPNKKQLPILLSVAIEHILQILYLWIHFYNVIGGKTLHLIVGVLYILVSVPMYIYTPETKQLNLEKCAAALS